MYKKAEFDGQSRLSFLNARYKKITESGKFRKNKYLKGCISIRKLNSDTEGAILEITPSNVSNAKFVVEEYCRWFNKEKYNSKGNKNSKRREKRAKTITPQTQQKNDRVKIIRPLYNKGFTQAEIVRETGINASSVRRILVELRK